MAAQHPLKELKLPMALKPRDSSSLKVTSFLLEKLTKGIYIFYVLYNYFSKSVIFIQVLDSFLVVSQKCTFLFIPLYSSHSLACLIVSGF